MLRAERDVFELDDLVEQTIDRLRPRLAGRPLELDLVDQPVAVDPVFLDEALTNVLENAIKYTPPQAPIRLRATVLDDHVRLTIEDAGAGVPADSLPRLFEKFYRVPETRRLSRAGTGIGLAVVRGLVEAMGGRVDARRERARRARDRLRAAACAGIRRGGAHVLHEAEDAAALDASARLDGRLMAERPRGEPAADAGRATVRASSSSRTMRRRGAPSGANCVLAATASRRPRPARPRIDRWQARRPDLILLDLGLPDMDGLRVITHDPAGSDDPDRHPVRPVRGAREGRRTRAGRRRLRHQAVRRRRAQRPPARGPAPCPPARRPTVDGRVVVGPLEPRRRAARGPTSAATPVDLTPREFEILRVLLANAGRLVTKGRLLRAVWGERVPGRGQLRLRPRQPAPPEARGRRPGGVAARPDRHRAGRRLPRIARPDDLRPTLKDLADPAAVPSWDPVRSSRA